MLYFQSQQRTVTIAAPQNDVNIDTLMGARPKCPMRLFVVIAAAITNAATANALDTGAGASYYGSQIITTVNTTIMAAAGAAAQSGLGGAGGLGGQGRPGLGGFQNGAGAPGSAGGAPVAASVGGTALKLRAKFYLIAPGITIRRGNGGAAASAAGGGGGGGHGAGTEGYYGRNGGKGQGRDGAATAQSGGNVGAQASTSPFEKIGLGGTGGNYAASGSGGSSSDGLYTANNGGGGLPGASAPAASAGRSVDGVVHLVVIGAAPVFIGSQV